MRVIVVGANGTIGRAVVAALEPRHDVVPVSRTHGAQRVDLTDPRSIAAMYKAVGRVDAVIATAGEAAFGPMAKLTDADFELGLRSKLMGQVNLVRLGVDAVADGGSFTLTSGILAHEPAPGSTSISLIGAALEAFVAAAALELPRGIRANIVSPGWVSETLAAMGRDPAAGTPAEVVARSYVAALDGSVSGTVIRAAGGK